MAYTEYSGQADTITNIGTTADERGMTTEEFKAAFSKDFADYKAWFNATFIPQLNDSNVLRQAIINGNFQVNQRAKSGTVTLSAGEYGHDRWKAGASGCTYTFATVANITTITITAGSLQQVIEGINLTSGNYTLSWAGTAQGKIGAGSYGASGITGTAVGGTNLTIEFGTGTISKVQFNYGDIALPFQMKSFGEEEIACKRYYIQYDGATDLSAGSAQTATSFFAQVQFPVTMRANPTLSTSTITGSNFAVISNGASLSITAMSLANVSKKCTSLNCVISGATGGYSGLFRIASSNWIAFTSEL